MRRLIVWTVGLLAGALSGLPAQAQDQRLLGMAITENPQVEYAAGFELARRSGINVTSISLFWNRIETAPGVYDPSLLDVFDPFFPPQGVAVNLTLAPTDINVERFPADLAGRSFADPDVIQRYGQFLDFVFSRILTTDLPVVVVSNELDAFLAPDNPEWDAYRSFFTAARDRIHRHRPDAVVGTTLTFNGVTGHWRDQALSTTELSAAALITYYPLDGAFRVRDPAVVGDDVQALLDLFSGQPVYLLEAGYPSSALNGSTVELQQRFFLELFQAWDRHASRVPMIVAEWLNDIDEAAVAAVEADLQLGDPAFAAYLGSLGLRDVTGAAKPAFFELRRQARQRGFNVQSVLHPAVGGAYFDPDRAGEGMIVELANADQLVLYWFTYEPDGTRLWLVGQGPVDATGADLVFNQALGGAFGEAFDPAAVTLEAWGTGRVEFQGCDSAQLSFDSTLPGYGSGAYPLQRTAPVAREFDLFCERGDPASSVE